ncbi:LOW QUALITY PROTEIN: UDP-glycosyltransferase 74B1-like [Chenopodium quinoa]|uniref:LOW QUALITY PROTEIN: UDP-glycosyltransferase 74B1-like n=1 Tax=Chenopodium quinoa TaxID=63459 RepID=UPI000B796AEB|nr:LOW QUALITY PROTEIN: UDP-glycosyltransferase 74B1-like [Chenopodium quinoa]
MIELNENKISKPHVVVVPYPSQGHINPLLQFAKRLASKGVKATLATTKQTMGSISSLRDVAVEAISDGFDDQGPPKVGSEDVFLNSFKSNGSSSLARIIESYQNTTFPVTCVVYDAFLPWALDVAKDYGLLGAAFFTNAAAVCAIFCCVGNGLIELPLRPVEVGCALPKMPLFKGNDLPTFLRKPESYPAYLAMKLRQFSNVDLADWIFCNSFEDLELEITEGIFEKWPAKLIGPMVPSSYLDGRIEGDIGYGASLWKPLSEKCKEWLQNKPKKSVIYISFGSMVSLTQEQMEEIAWALKQSNYYFLWVVRDSQASKLPKEFLEDVEITQKGMVVTWCNQLEVLAHEATACFVTHCGWNSTLEGLSLGVPMVGVPQWSDQLPDAKFIEEVWGVGVWAKEDDKGVVRKEHLSECLKEVMEGERSEEIRENALKWKELSKKAVSDGGSSDNHVEDFVEHLKCTSFSTKKPNGSLVS